MYTLCRRKTDDVCRSGENVISRRRTSAVNSPSIWPMENKADEPGRNHVQRKWEICELKLYACRLLNTLNHFLFPSPGGHIYRMSFAYFDSTRKKYDKHFHVITHPAMEWTIHVVAKIVLNWTFEMIWIVFCLRDGVSLVQCNPLTNFCISLLL